MKRHVIIAVTTLGLALGLGLFGPLATSTATNTSVGCATPSFAQPAGSPFSAGQGPASVAVGDFNLDGKLDLAVANAASGNVTILLGDGSGGFTQATGSPVGAGQGPAPVAVGDFNRDGKPDLAVASADGVTILLGDGSGGFIEPAGSPVGTGNQTQSVAVGDFNRDGKPDLAVASADGVTILLGDGSGGFTEPAGSPVGAGNAFTAVAVGDFNRDGKPDLAVVDIDSSTGTLQLNTCTATNSPTIGGATLSRQQGAAGTISTIATVSDGQDPAGALKVTATSLPAGLSVTGITNTNGTVTATVAAACTAALGKHLVELRVTDSGSLTATDNLTVNVTASNPPVITLKPHDLEGYEPNFGYPKKFML
jgi:hypothetical protein